mgnify:FL=1
MIKLYDRKKDYINEDLIKEALRTGLDNIKPSEDLIAKTIAKCKGELSSKAEVESKRNRPVMWVYRIGAPIAATALVLLLILNSQNVLFRHKTARDAEPLNSAMLGTAQAQEESMSPETESPEVMDDRSGSQAPAVVDPDSTINGKQDLKYFALTGKPEDVAMLKSYAVRDDVQGETPELREVFRHIAGAYNSDNRADYVLDEANIVRIRTLVGEGVHADTLKNSVSYRDILGDEGYWALPLEDNQGDLRAFLKVTELSGTNIAVPSSGNDKIYKFEGKDYFVSADSRAEISSLEPMFDRKALMLLIEQSCKLKDGPVIVDINNGEDFIVFFGDNEKQLGMPFFTNTGLFGLENSEVYEIARMFDIISEHIQ